MNDCLIEKLKDVAQVLPGFNDEMVRLSDAIAIVRQHEAERPLWVEPGKAYHLDFNYTGGDALIDSCENVQELADKVSRCGYSAKQPLFKHGSFTSHSGLTLPDKIDCDALTNADWDANAAWVASRMIFSKVVGIPSGGLAFARALEPYVTPAGQVLLIDDVLTTGTSMEEARKKYPDAIGVVLFSRTRNVPGWITARFVEQGGQPGERRAEKGTVAQETGAARTKGVVFDAAHMENVVFSDRKPTTKLTGCSSESSLTRPSDYVGTIYDNPIIAGGDRSEIRDNNEPWPSLAYPLSIALHEALKDIPVSMARCIKVAEDVVRTMEPVSGSDNGVTGIQSAESPAGRVDNAAQAQFDSEAPTKEQPVEIAQHDTLHNAWQCLKRCQGESIEEDKPYVDRAFEILNKLVCEHKREVIDPMLVAALKDAVHFVRNRHNMGRGVREEKRLAVLANAQEVLAQLEEQERRGS